MKEEVEKSKQRLDADNMERERRKKNVMIREVPESTAESSKDKAVHDHQCAAAILDVHSDAIEGVFRAGRPPTRDEGPRPLIITLKSHELAMDLHRHGRGRRVPNPDDDEMIFWVNPDLIAADRTAQFKAREELRKRRNQRTDPQSRPVVSNSNNTVVNSVDEHANVSMGSFLRSQ